MDGGARVKTQDACVGLGWPFLARMKRRLPRLARPSNVFPMELAAAMHLHRLMMFKPWIYRHGASPVGIVISRYAPAIDSAISEIRRTPAPAQPTPRRRLVDMNRGGTLRNSELRITARASQRLTTTTSRYSLGTTSEDLAATFSRSSSAAMSRSSAACLGASSAANALSVGP